jgi:hypothetical protein
MVLISQKISTIGLLFPEIGCLFISPLLRGIEAEASDPRRSDQSAGAFANRAGDSPIMWLFSKQVSGKAPIHHSYRELGEELLRIGYQGDFQFPKDSLDGMITLGGENRKKQSDGNQFQIE